MTAEISTLKPMLSTRIIKTPQSTIDERTEAKTDLEICHEMHLVGLKHLSDQLITCFKKEGCS